MNLILKVNGKSIQYWPLQFPVVSRFEKPEDKFNIRQKYLNDMVLLAKIEHAALLEKETDWQLYVEVRAKFQPKDVFEGPADIKEPILVVDMKPPAEYSNVKSLYPQLKTMP